MQADTGSGAQFNSEEIHQRFYASWPLYGMRWAMIMLNEFRKDGWEKKVHVDENIEKSREQKLWEQINKSVAVCELIKLHKMEMVLICYQ